MLVLGGLPALTEVFEVLIVAVVVVVLIVFLVGVLGVDVVIEEVVILLCVFTCWNSAVSVAGPKTLTRVALLERLANHD